MKFILTNFGPTYPLGIGGGALSNIDLLKLLKRLGYDVVNIGFFEQKSLSEYNDIFSQAKELGIVKGTIGRYLYLWNKEI